MIPRVTQLPVLPKLPHKTRPHTTNEPPKTSTNRLLSPLPTRLVCTHPTVCIPASILHMKQSAQSVEAVEDWIFLRFLVRLLSQILGITITLLSQRNPTFQTKTSTTISILNLIFTRNGQNELVINRILTFRITGRPIIFTLFNKQLFVIEVFSELPHSSERYTKVRHIL